MSRRSNRSANAWFRATAYGVGAALWFAASLHAGFDAAVLCVALVGVSLSMRTGGEPALVHALLSPKGRRTGELSWSGAFHGGIVASVTLAALFWPQGAAGRVLLLCVSLVWVGYAAAKAGCAQIGCCGWLDGPLRRSAMKRQKLESFAGCALAVFTFLPLLRREHSVWLDLAVFAVAVTMHATLRGRVARGNPPVADVRSVLSVAAGGYAAAPKYVSGAAVAHSSLASLDYDILATKP